MTEALRRSIYREHLEECAMLYERRQLCLEDPESALEDIAEHDARMDAHIDGLVLGRELALEVCLEALEDGDPTTIHAVTRVLLRGPEVASLALTSSSLAIDDEDQHRRRAALASALAFELRPAWVTELGPALDDPELAPLVIRALGARRIRPAAPVLRAKLAHAKEHELLGLIWALGEMRDHTALPFFHQLLGHADDPQLWSALALACLKLGDTQIVGLLRSGAALSTWSPIGQVLGFEVPFGWLLDALEMDLRADMVTALALRGDPGCFAALLELLDHERYGRLAAGALFAITGAPLLADVDEPDPIDDPGEDPDPDPDIRDAGWVELPRDPAVWRSWIAADPQRWLVGQRYRLGASIDRGATARAALCCAVPLEIREALFDELALCHGLDPRVRPDGLAQRQLDAIHYEGPPPPVLDRKLHRATPDQAGAA